MIRVIIRNTTTGTVLAQRDLPETMLTALQRAFPTADEALTWMLQTLREHLKAIKTGQESSAWAATLEASKQASEAEFETEFPQ